jgi:fumarylacetoacetate (FAA) hydrolase
MKLATYQDGSRDGQLVVVSRDLSQAVHANGIASRLQQVLDDWNFLAPQLEDLSVTLNQGRARHSFAFDPQRCLAPLPRAYQWADGSAYLPHIARVRAARGVAMPESLQTDPLMYQGGSDDFLGPCQPAWFGAESWGIDFEAELAVITGDVAMGANAAQGLDGVRLLMLVNDWSLRQLIPAELAKGFGFVHGKPATAFGPVAVTPDELGAAWQGGRVHGTLHCVWNGKKVARCDSGADMAFHFGELIAHLAKTRNVRAGSIVGSGTISNADAANGWCCIAEQRALETAAHGEPRTRYMATGDTIRIEWLDGDGQRVFGTIAQRVTGPNDTPATADEAEAEDTGASAEAAGAPAGGTPEAADAAVTPPPDSADAPPPGTAD